MPTLSQCQILNNILEKRAPPDNASGEDGETEAAQQEQARPIAVVGYPRVTTPQPRHSEYQYVQETGRPLSVGSKIKSPLATIDADREVTPFQKLRMQMVEKTAQVLPGWKARGLWTNESAARWRASSASLLSIKSSVFQRQSTYADFFGEGANARAFHPWSRTASQRHLPVNLALERLMTPEIISQLKGQASASPPAVAEKVPLKQSDSFKQILGSVQEGEVSSKPSVRFLEDEVKKENDDAQPDTEKPTPEGEETPDEKANLATDLKSCSDDIKQQLYQLGWRKPEKKKRKSKKKYEDKSRNPKLTYMTMPKLDLMRDPMLRKLSKKSKNVMVQAHPPKMRPKAVCFNIVGAHLTHLLVWKSFQRDVLAEYDEVKVESIQFVPRSIFVPRTKNSDPVENRWVITLTNEWYRSRVTGMDIRFGDFTTQLRRYDDVVNLEYRQYTRMTDMMKMIKPKHG